MTPVRELAAWLKERTVDYNWFEVDPPDRNMDICPELRPCPACGSVWVELVAVGAPDPEVHGRVKKQRIDFDLQMVVVSVPGLYFQNIVAVRVECAEGHSFETNGRSYIETPSWGNVSVSFGPMYVLAGPGRGRLRRPRRVRG